MTLRVKVMVVAAVAAIFLSLSVGLVALDKQLNRFPYRSVCVFGDGSVIGDEFCAGSPQFSDGPEGASWRGWAYIPDDQPLPEIGTAINDPIWDINS